MNYSFESIASEEYLKLSEKLLSLAKDPETQEKMRLILYEGQCGSFKTDNKLHIRSNSFWEGQKRISYAYMLATHPETFDLLAENNIDLFHGTASNALPHILKYGLQSVNTQVKRGSYPEGVEAWSRIAGGRDFISFTNVLNVALDYVEMNVDHPFAKHGTFGTVIGINSEALSPTKRCYVKSDVPEVGIVDELPLENFGVILVPESKVKFVQKLIGNLNISVGACDIDDRFFNFDKYDESIYIDEEKFEQIQNRPKKESHIFAHHSLKELTESRKISDLFNLRKLFKNINKGKEHENSRDNI